MIKLNIASITIKLKIDEYFRKEFIININKKILKFFFTNFIPFHPK